MILRLFFVLSLLCLSSVTAMADEYAVPNWSNLARTLVRFKAINLKEPKIIDEYSIITECDLYKAFYHNDFKWNEVREAVRSTAADKMATYPDKYYFQTPLQLDRYDFSSKVYRFRSASIIYNINSFPLYAVEGNSCGSSDIQFIPRTYHLVLPEPVYMDGLPLSPEEGDVVLKLMDVDHNTDRVVYARFNFGITSIDPMVKKTSVTRPDIIESFIQQGMLRGQEIRLNGRLDSLEFFEDPDGKRLIYRYRP